MENASSRRDASHNAEEDGADNGTRDIHAHDAATFRRVQAIPLANQRDIRFARYAMRRANRLTLQANEHRQRNADEHRAQVAEFLQNKCGRRRQDLRQGRTYQRAVARHQQHQRDAEQ